MFGRRRQKDHAWVNVHLIHAWDNPKKLSGRLVAMDNIGITVETSERDVHFVPWNNVSDVHTELEVIVR